MVHPLDNMIWNAITTGNRDITIIDGEFGFYQPGITPFVGFKELNNKNLDQLHAIIPVGERVAISYFNKPSLDENKWKVVHPMDITQMLYEKPVSSFTTKNSSLIVPLGMEHVPQMIELTALTKPGPFLEKTILFGNYFQFRWQRNHSKIRTPLPCRKNAQAFAVLQ